MLKKYTIVALAALIISSNVHSMGSWNRFWAPSTVAAATYAVRSFTESAKCEPTDNSNQYMPLPTFVSYNRSKSDNGTINIKVDARAVDSENRSGFLYELFSLFSPRILESQRQREEKIKQRLQEKYKSLELESEFEEQQNFYRCMSSLENPINAVSDGQYRRCIKESLPRNTSINISVSEKKGHPLNPDTVFWFKRAA